MPGKDGLKAGWQLKFTIDDRCVTSRALVSWSGSRIHNGTVRLSAFMSIYVQQCVYMHGPIIPHDKAHKMPISIASYL